MAKMNFQQPFLQSSVSHDHSEFILICWFDVQETFIFINNIGNGCADLWKLYIYNKHQYLPAYIIYW